MNVAVRALDGVAAVLALTGVTVALTGGGVVAGVSLTRPEDLVVALVAVVAFRLLLAPVAPPAVRPARAVGVGVAVYVVVMGFIALTRHWALRTHALDLGYYVQVVWNIAAGRGALVTMPPMHAWGDHLSPVLYVFTPFGWLGGVAPALLLGRTILLAAGALAVYGYARHHVALPGAAAALAVLYLLNPTLHGINIRDVHPQSFVIPLLIAAALAFDRGRYLWCALALVAALGTREDAAIAVAGFGVWLAVARGRWVAGAAVAGASVGVLALDIYVLMPALRGEPYVHLTRYTHLGGTFGEIVATLLTRPDLWVPVLFTPAKLVYLLALLAPLAFLPLLAPRVAVAALPALAINLLSMDPRLLNYRAQYQSFVLPFLVLAAVHGYAWLEARSDGRTLGGRRLPATALVAGTLLAITLTARTVNDLGVRFWRLGPGERAAYTLMARIPAGASVSAYERLVPHLATRPEAYVFPRGVGRSEYVLDFAFRLEQVPLPGYRELAREGPWRLLRREPGVSG